MLARAALARNSESPTPWPVPAALTPWGRARGLPLDERARAFRKAMLRGVHTKRGAPAPRSTAGVYTNVARATLAFTGAQAEVLRRARRALEAREGRTFALSTVVELSCAELLSGGAPLPPRILPTLLRLERGREAEGARNADVQLHADQVEIVDEVAAEFRGQFDPEAPRERAVAAAVLAALARWEAGEPEGSRENPLRSRAATGPKPGPEATKVAAPWHYMALPCDRRSASAAQGGRARETRRPAPHLENGIAPAKRARSHEPAELARTPWALADPPVSYTSHRIRKSGGGTRQLFEPNEHLMARQVEVAEALRPLVAGSPLAYGVSGDGAVDGAWCHAARRFVGRLDVASFFPSCTVRHVAAALRRVGFDGADVERIVRLVTWQGALPQGAPTSPAIAALVFRELDGRLHRRALDLGVRCTRYVDDFSTSGSTWIAVHRMHSFIECELRELGFKVNRKKTRIIGNHHQQTAVGYTVNADHPTLPARKRRRVREELRRAEQRGLRTRHDAQGRVVEERDRIEGGVAYVESVYPELGGRMRARLERAPHQVEPPEPARTPRKRPYPRRSGVAVRLRRRAALARELLEEVGAGKGVREVARSRGIAPSEASNMIRLARVLASHPRLEAELPGFRAGWAGVRAALPLLERAEDPIVVAAELARLGARELRSEVRRRLRSCRSSGHQRL